MSKKLSLIALISVLALLNASAVLASDIQQDEIQPLCAPSGYSSTLTDCLSMGPTAYVDDMAEIGIIFPERGLPSQPSIYEKQELEYAYAKSKAKQLRIFSTAQEAFTGTTPYRTMDPGQVYVSIEDWMDIGDKRVYMIEPGSWVRWDEISMQVYPSKFGGQEFFETPERNF
ncbi:MAG: hypothetical protein JRI61_05085 [Deltaproteobacteria bacterium]|nr:hypothetical protein [Deltaproteobacteria bacterium]